MQILEYSLKKEKLLSSRTVANFFIVRSSFENNNKKWTNLYLFDPHYKLDWSSQHRHKFKLKITALFHKDTTDKKDDSLKEKTIEINKPLTLRRDENEIMFETDQSDIRYTNIEYDPVEKVLYILELATKSLILIDLLTYSCKVHNLTALGNIFGFQITETRQNMLIFGETMITSYHLQQQALSKMIHLSGIINLRSCKLAEKAAVICYTALEIIVFEQETLNPIDKFGLLATSSSRILKVETTKDHVCIMVEKFYQDYQKRFAIYKSKLSQFTFDFLREAPFLTTYPHEIIESDHTSASRVSEVVADFIFSQDGTVVFIAWTSTALQVQRFKGDGCDLDLTFRFRWCLGRSVVFRYSCGALLLNVFRNKEEYEFRRCALVLPDLMFCYPEHCTTAVPVYSDDSDNEAEVWSYAKTTDKNNIPIHVLKRRKD